MKFPEPRIAHAETHPKRWVNLTVAREFLGMSYYSLQCAIDRGELKVELKGRWRKVHVEELCRFDEWQRARLAS